MNLIVQNTDGDVEVKKILDMRMVDGDGIAVLVADNEKHPYNTNPVYFDPV